MKQFYPRLRSTSIGGSTNGGGYGAGYRAGQSIGMNPGLRSAGSSRVLIG